MKAVPTINMTLDANNAKDAFCEVHYWDALKHMNAGIHGKYHGISIVDRIRHLNKALLLLQTVYRVNRDYRRCDWDSVEKYITKTSFWIDRANDERRLNDTE